MFMMMMTMMMMSVWVVGMSKKIGAELWLCIRFTASVFSLNQYFSLNICCPFPFPR